ncbi:MAG: methionyl-tRNA formyltransferase, partial [Candidatus Cryptobacteroides sp.]
VTTFMIDAGVDTGKIMYREQCPILPTDTAGTLHDKLMVLGADLVEQTVEALIEGSVEFRVQRSFIQGAEVLKGAPKITKEMCRIDWNRPSVQVCNFIRGLSPYPAAWTEIATEGETPLVLKVFFAEKLPSEVYENLRAGRTVTPGRILSDGKGIFAVATADGAVALTDLQLAGKKRMDARTFLLGFREPENYSIV